MTNFGLFPYNKAIFKIILRRKYVKNNENYGRKRGRSLRVIRIY